MRIVMDIHSIQVFFIKNYVLFIFRGEDCPDVTSTTHHFTQPIMVIHVILSKKKKTTTLSVTLVY